MTTRAIIARELGVSKDTVSKYARAIGISCDPRSTRRLTDDEAKSLRTALSTRNGRSFGRTCDVCGEQGHSSNTCPDHIEHKRCNVCGDKKPRNSFPVVIQTGRKGKRLGGTCKDCDKERLKVRYGTVEGRAKAIVSSAKARADVSITVLDVLEMLAQQDNKCFYSGLPMTCNRGFYGFSLDRKNNEDRCYSKDNTVLCCWGINQMKRDMGLAEFIGICKAIAMHHQ